MIRKARRPTLCLLLIAGLSMGASADRPKQIVEETVDKVLKVLRDPKLQGAEHRQTRLDKIRDIANRVFDWEDMAKRSLGVHWRNLDKKQQQRFVDVFKGLLADRYMSDLDRFQGNEKVQVKDAQKLSEDVSKVNTVIVTHSGERVPIDYFMHPEDGTWRIHDFSVEGVSLVSHYRQSFSRYLVNKDFDSLVSRLEQKL